MIRGDGSTDPVEGARLFVERMIERDFSVPEATRAGPRDPVGSTFDDYDRVPVRQQEAE